MPTTTCDVYRVGRAPPSTPDISAAIITLIPQYAESRKVGEKDDNSLRYTAIAYCDLTTDIRDDFGQFVVNTNFDTIYVPDKNGQPYKVTYIERIGRGTSADQKKVYLERGAQV